MKIKFMKSRALDTLKKDDLEINLNSYKGDNSWLHQKYNEEELFGIYNKVEFPDFELIKEKGTKADFENMKILYTALKDLTLSQASDERIWAGLAHSYFWDYMQVRWPLPDNRNDKNSHVLNNYFFWNSTKAPFLNGLSRLWWYAKYTYDDTLDDPFELTKYICEHDINGKIFYLLSCNFVTNDVIFKNIIKAIKKFEEDNRPISRAEFKKLVPYLNRISGKIVFDSLNADDLMNIVTNKLHNIINN